MSAQLISALKERARARNGSANQVKSPPPTLTDTVDVCICNRQFQDILCRSCGYIFVGRQRKKCVFHPNEILLMDAAVCPKCKTDCLMEIRTTETPIKKNDEVIGELTNLRQRRSSGLSSRRTSIGSLDSADWEKEMGFMPMSVTNEPLKEDDDVSSESKAKKNLFADVNIEKNVSVPQQHYVSKLQTDSASPEITVESFTGAHLSERFAASNTSKGSHDGLAQLMSNQSITKPEKKLVDTESQTEFIVQGIDELKLMTSSKTRQSKDPTVESCMYEPKKAGSAQGNYNLLKRAIRNISGYPNTPHDKMNDLCIGERR